MQVFGEEVHTRRQNATAGFDLHNRACGMISWWLLMVGGLLWGCSPFSLTFFFGFFVFFLTRYFGDDFWSAVTSTFVRRFGFWSAVIWLRPAVASAFGLRLLTCWSAIVSTFGLRLLWLLVYRLCSAVV